LEVQSLAIPEVKLLTPRRFRDERGFFSESYNARVFAEAGIVGPFVQDNHAYSSQAGVVRGLHFQIAPRAQGKLVRVTRGAMLDVAVDIRQGSPTYGRHVSAVLSAANWTQIWVPQGFAHGYCTLEPDTEVLYKVTDYYAPEYERGVHWNDAALAIAWPVSGDTSIVSAKDMQLPPLAEMPAYFHYDPEAAVAGNAGNRQRAGS
jgi:dTDP-4-dehydrorhamnose 3,5-epimerase